MTLQEMFSELEMLEKQMLICEPFERNGIAIAYMAVQKSIIVRLRRYTEEFNNVLIFEKKAA